MKIARRPKQVGELPTREEQHAEGQRVGVHDPLELRRADVQVLLDRGQRDVHHRVVEHDHEQPDGDGRERPPLPVLRREEPRPHACRLEKVGDCSRAVTRTLPRVSDFVWTPTPEQVESANVTRLAQRLGVERYHDLHRISIDEPERFWPALIDDLGLEFSEPWTHVVDVSRGPEWAQWFVGGKLNLAWSCVHSWAAGELAEEEAAVWQAEDGSSNGADVARAVGCRLPPRRRACVDRNRRRAMRSGSSCRCRRRWRSLHTRARTSARCRCRSSPASRRRRSPRGWRMRRRRR